MSMRAVISGVLILMLTPVSSLAAICHLSCAMRPESPRHSSATHLGEARHAAHHHHTDFENTGHAGAVNAVPQRVASGHACCNADQSAFSPACLTLRSSSFSRSIITTGLSTTVALPATAAMASAANERSRRHAPGNTHLLASLSRSIPLRI